MQAAKEVIQPIASSTKRVTWERIVAISTENHSLQTNKATQEADSETDEGNDYKAQNEFVGGNCACEIANPSNSGGDKSTNISENVRDRYCGVNNHSFQLNYLFLNVHSQKRFIFIRLLKSPIITIRKAMPTK